MPSCEFRFTFCYEHPATQGTLLGLQSDILPKQIRGFPDTQT